MHPRMFHWAYGRRGRGSDCCNLHDVSYPHHHFHSGEEPGGGFGVRRPLRFLAWKLGLAEPQVSEFAAILNDLKTERAQAAVDDRRSLTALADAAAGESFDQAHADVARQLRLQSAERLQGAVVQALSRMHALLDQEQRSRLAFLLRSGTLVM